MESALPVPQALRRRRRRGRFEFLSEFEGIVVSGEEGVIKPDPSIFRILLARYRIAPESAVFVDGNAANAAAAQSARHARHPFPLALAVAQRARGARHSVTRVKL